MSDTVHTDTQTHTCSDSSVLRSGEEVTLWDDDGGESQHTHHDQVDKAGLRRAVEGVVQPGDEGAHDEEGDPTVVQPKDTQTKWAALLKCPGANQYVRQGEWLHVSTVSYLEKTLETASEWQ